MVEKKGIKKKWLSLKYSYTYAKMNKKYKLLLLKCSLIVQSKRNQEKVVVTKICFYGETKQKMKVSATKIQPNGSDKKEY